MKQSWRNEKNVQLVKILQWSLIGLRRLIVKISIMSWSSSSSFLPNVCQYRLTEISKQLMRRMKKSKRYFLLYMICSSKRWKFEKKRARQKEEEENRSPRVVYDAHSTCLSNSIEINNSNELLEMISNWYLMIFLSLSFSRRIDACLCVSMSMFLSLLHAQFDRLKCCVCVYIKYEKRTMNHHREKYFLRKRFEMFEVWSWEWKRRWELWFVNVNRYECSILVINWYFSKNKCVNHLLRNDTSIYVHSLKEMKSTWIFEESLEKFLFLLDRSFNRIKWSLEYVNKSISDQKLWLSSLGI